MSQAKKTKSTKRVVICLLFLFLPSVFSQSRQEYNRLVFKFQKERSLQCAVLIHCHIRSGFYKSGELVMDMRTIAACDWVFFNMLTYHLSRTYYCTPKLNGWNLKMMVSKFRISCSRGWISGEPFVKLQGCTWHSLDITFPVTLWALHGVRSNTSLLGLWWILLWWYLTRGKDSGWIAGDATGMTHDIIHQC